MLLNCSMVVDISSLIWQSNTKSSLGSVNMYLFRIYAPVFPTKFDTKKEMLPPTKCTYSYTKCTEIVKLHVDPLQAVRPNNISNATAFYSIFVQGSQTSNHHVSGNCQTADGNVSNSGNMNGATAGGTDDDVWRGHSIAALRRRASELNNSIPSYLHQNYDHHNSVY